MTIKEVEDILSKISYKNEVKFSCSLPGWDDSIEIRLLANVECSYQRDGSELPVVCRIMVSSDVSEQHLIRQIYYMIKNYEMHELDEWFLYDNVRLYDPHKKD